MKKNKKKDKKNKKAAFQGSSWGGVPPNAGHIFQQSGSGSYGGQQRQGIEDAIIIDDANSQNTHKATVGSFSGTMSGGGRSSMGSSGRQ
jgi:hypothetical protein